VLVLFPLHQLPVRIWYRIPGPVCCFVLWHWIWDWFPLEQWFVGDDGGSFVCFLRVSTEFLLSPECFRALCSLAMVGAVLFDFCSREMLVFWRYIYFHPLASIFTDRLVHRLLTFGCCVWPTVITPVVLPLLARLIGILMSFILVLEYRLPMQSRLERWKGGGDLRIAIPAITVGIRQDSNTSRKRPSTIHNAV